MLLTDLQFMRQGRPVRSVLPSEARLLLPIQDEGPNHRRALLMLHGFSSSPAVFRVMHPAIVGYDAIVCPVLPGHADSLLAFEATTASEWLQAADSACARLMRDYESVDVLGFSLGGVLACYVSQRYPIHRLFLLAPALSLHTNVPLMRWAARWLRRCGLRYLKNRAGNFYTTRHMELVYRQQPLAAIVEILTLIQRFQWTPPECPIDVFLGRFDAVVDSNALAHRFKSLPQARIHWLEHTAHALPLDGDVDAILSILHQPIDIH